MLIDNNISAREMKRVVLIARTRCSSATHVARESPLAELTSHLWIAQSEEAKLKGHASDCRVPNSVSRLIGT